MTFTEIVDKVCTRLNLTSDEAVERVGEEVNEVYAEVVMDVGLHTSSQDTLTGVTADGSRLVTFGDDDIDGIQKIVAVRNPEFPAPTGALTEVSRDELNAYTEGTWPPHMFAIERMGAHTVTIKLDCEAEEDDVELEADVMVDTPILSGDDEPAFSTNYHDLLVRGVLAIELEKLEKYAEAKTQQDKYDRRLSALRLFIAASAYKQIHQGKSTRVRPGVRLVS